MQLPTACAGETTAYTTGFHPAPIKHYSIFLAYFSSPYIRPYGSADPSQIHNGVGAGVGFLFDVEEHCVGHKILCLHGVFLLSPTSRWGGGTAPPLPPATEHTGPSLHGAAGCRPQGEKFLKSHRLPLDRGGGSDYTIARGAGQRLAHRLFCFY